MGNCCSSSEPAAFSSPGRPLGSTPAGPSSVGVPASATRPPPKVGGPPRTLGGASAGESSSADAEEARRRAAAAAEARAQAAKGGDLSKKLAEQRKLTHRATLEEASRKNLREREVDANADVLRNS